MKRVLKKEEIDRLKDAIVVPKDIEAGIVITTGSFAAIGKTTDLTVLIAAGLQQLISSNVLNKDLIDTIVSTLEYDKEDNNDKKELIKKFMDAFDINEEEMKEVLNEKE